MERTPTPVQKHPDSLDDSDTPIYDQMMAEFNEKYATPLSDTGSTAQQEFENIPPSELPDQTVQRLDSALGQNVDANEIIKLDAALERASEIVRTNPNLQNAVERESTLRVKALNRLDRAQRHATLLSAREWRLQGRTARLETKLASVKPGSRKHMRIERSLIHARYKKALVGLKQEKIFGRMHDRSAGFSKEIQKNEQIERSRDQWLIARKVAVEKKRRRMIAKKYTLEMEQSSPNKKQKIRRELYNDVHRRERLRKEMLSWKGNGIKQFESRLIAEADMKYKDRLRGNP
ncbi:MAG: hypothetical protein QG549_806 [Patescibacteria group bacterium]|nr:hypothetical protein [Patescibacteria group bacterium]